MGYWLPDGGLEGEFRIIFGFHTGIYKFYFISKNMNNVNKRRLKDSIE